MKRWAPSAPQRQLAEYLAAGYSLNRACIVLSQNYATAWKWVQTEQMQEYIADRRRALMASQGLMFESSVALAQAIVLQGLTGERTVSDPTLALAERVLSQTLWKLAKPIDRTRDGLPEPEVGQLPEGRA